MDVVTAFRVVGHLGGCDHCICSGSPQWVRSPHSSIVDNIDVTVSVFSSSGGTNCQR